MTLTTATAVPLVVGRKIVLVPIQDLRARMARCQTVTIDLGAGDGRHALRLARRDPDRFVLALDADASAMRETSSRAARKPERGGAPNAAFVCMPVEALPGPLTGVAGEILVLYPWGSLLQGVVLPSPDVLAALAGLARPGCRLRVRVNVSALRDMKVRGLLPEVDEAYCCRVLVPSYGAAGWDLRPPRITWTDPETPWARRLSQGRPIEVLDLEGRWVQCGP